MAVFAGRKVRRQRRLAIRRFAISLTYVLGGLLGASGAAVLAEEAKESAAAPLNTLAPQEEAAGWKLLFDGKTTNGWRMYKGDAVSPGWKVIDGTLVRAADGAGQIITTDKYDWFELSLDYKISRGGNSGITFHVTEDGVDPGATGPEVQILDNKEGGDPQKAGWLYQLYHPDFDATHPAGQWNHVRILVTPQKCETYMNGRKYYEYVIGSPDWDKRVAQSKFINFPNWGKAKNGYIHLQDHGNWVAFRNIKIRPIKAE
jgi:hypothetical protein